MSEEAIRVHKLTAEEWVPMAEKAHIVLFDEVRPAYMNRIDWVLMAIKNDIPMGYVTVRELDGENIYWGYGGAFPGTINTAWAVSMYKKGIEACEKMGFKNIFSSVKNTNVSMLKMALSQGFLVTGVRVFKDEIYCEINRELHKE